MHFAVRLFTVIAISALPWLDAVAQLRQPPARTVAKIVPKVGSVSTTNSAATLAAMLAGGGVVISNATFRGAEAAAGTFAGAQGSIGIESGVVLSTGRAADVVGPNVDTAWSTDNAEAGDASLDALVAPYQTYDAAVLEFDVTPSAGTLSVRFVFASEEYNEFVGSPFNDVIAIFVNGVNCANYGGRPVSVNSINRDVNGALFVDNDTGTRDTEMDGITAPLECVANVTPGTLNHVKIAIADTSDAAYDAAVFLAAAGVASPASGPPTLSNVVKAIEYRHAEWDHYFVTAIAGEIAKLDDGTFKGWARTGQAFNVFVTGTPGTADVCRFFSTASACGSAHTSTRRPTSECATVKANSDWQFEDVVFGLVVPFADGSCPKGLQGLYRLYNDGMGAAPNHRFLTDPGELAVMIALGGYRKGTTASSAAYRCRSPGSSRGARAPRDGAWRGAEVEPRPTARNPAAEARRTI